MTHAPGACRICRAPATRSAGFVEYLPGRRLEVRDCPECGCRFTAHDPAVYEDLHRTGALDYYAGYRDLAADAARAFEARDREALRRALPDAKYRFVMDELDRLAPGTRVLELGCSRGYLTAYALLRGLDATGADASAEAVGAARAAFGDHFLVAGQPEVAARAPYGFIYHVGMIGCVADPLALTRELLAMLAPGGRLAFNAPNRAALPAGQAWFASAPPPDLVTLFPEGFWRERCAREATVEEEVALVDPQRRLEEALRGIGLAARAARAAARLGAAIGVGALVPRRRAPFGLLVRMAPC